MQLPDREPRESKSFCEGVVRQKGGGALGDNPHTSGTPEHTAWIDGFQAAAGASAWAISTAYTRGQLATNDGNVYQCIVAGTSAGSGGPTGNAPRIVDNTATWKYQSPGTAVDLSCCGYPAADAGPYVGAWA